jgi:hypothetical protein
VVQPAALEVAVPSCCDGSALSERDILELKL